MSIAELYEVFFMFFTMEKNKHNGLSYFVSFTK